MTTETRQVIQYVAVAMFVVFIGAILWVFVHTYMVGAAPDGVILAYVGAIFGTITSILSVNAGANTAQNATAQANQNTAAVVAAANGSAGPVAKAHVGLNPTPDSKSTSTGGPVDPAASDSGGGA